MDGNRISLEGVLLMKLPQHFQEHPGTIVSAGALLFAGIDGFQHSPVILAGAITLASALAAVVAFHKGRAIELVGAVCVLYGYIAWVVTH